MGLSHLGLELGVDICTNRERCGVLHNSGF